MTESPAALLRSAAKLMKERAEAATEGPWAWEATGEKDNSWAVGFVQDEDGTTLTGQLETGQGIVIDGICEDIDGNLSDAEHIASWHPAVALAVAGWLDAEADAHEVYEGSTMDEALAVARIYLGTEGEGQSDA